MALLYNFFFAGKNLIDFTQQSRVQFSIHVNKIPSAHSGLIENGERIYLTDSGESLGFVKSAVYNRSALVGKKDADGNSDIRFYPDLQDITVTVECDATVDNGTVVINGLTLEEGNTVTFHVSDYAAKGFISDIEVLS